MLRVRRRWAARCCLRLMLPPKPQRSSLPLAKVGSVGQGGSARGLSHILSATIYDCGPAGLVRRPLCQGFRLLGSSFGLGLPVLSAPKATSAHKSVLLYRLALHRSSLSSSPSAGLSTTHSPSLYASPLCAARAFAVTFPIASPGLTRGTSDLRENRAIPTAARSPPSSPHSYV